MRHEYELKKLDAEASLEQSKHESTRLEITNKPKPKIPFFDEKVDEIDSFLERFVWVADGCNGEKADWPYQANILEREQQKFTSDYVDLIGRIMLKSRRLYSKDSTAPRRATGRS